MEMRELSLAKKWAGDANVEPMRREHHGKVMGCHLN
jgi:hypothetical protein